MLKVILNKLANKTPSNVISIPAAESTQGTGGTVMESTGIWTYRL